MRQIDYPKLVKRILTRAFSFPDTIGVLVGREKSGQVFFRRVKRLSARRASRHPAPIVRVLAEKYYEGVITRLKIMAEMDITMRGRRQNGKFMVGDKYCVAVVIPDGHGWEVFHIE